MFFLMFAVINPACNGFGLYQILYVNIVSNKCEYEIGLYAWCMDEWKWSQEGAPLQELLKDRWD